MATIGLSRLFIAHGVITSAAAVVLIVDPGLIPSTVGVSLDQRANIVVFLLAGAEVGFATLSFGASRLTDVRARSLIAWSCIAFHISSAALELVAFAQGVGAAILANIVARLIIVVLFWINTEPL